MALVTTTVAVFGSCNMDLVAYVDEAPALGETVRGNAFETVAGGKGANQAVAAALAGAHVTMMGALGADDFGRQIRAGLRQCGVNTAQLRTVEGRSGTAHIVVDADGRNSIVAVPSANSHVTGLSGGDEESIAQADALLVQLEIPIDGVRAAAEAAQRNSTRVVLTPAPATDLPASLLEQIDVLVPNEHEAAVLVGRSDPERALEALLELVPEVVITLGEQGALYGNRSGEVIESPGFPVHAIDTTAAGDTFTGVLTVAQTEGRPMSESLRLASAAAALSVQRNGASSSMPSRKEMNEFLGES